MRRHVELRTPIQPACTEFGSHVALSQHLLSFLYCTDSRKTCSWSWPYRTRTVFLIRAAASTRRAYLSPGWCVACASATSQRSPTIRRHQSSICHLLTSSDSRRVVQIDRSDHVTLVSFYLRVLVRPHTHTHTHAQGARHCASTESSMACLGACQLPPR